MTFTSLPNTIALIPDGNRRWAKSHRLSMVDAYKHGVNKFIDFSEWCNNYNIRNVSVWALSLENLRRAKNEVKVLFRIYEKTCKDQKVIDRLMGTETKFNIISERKVLPRNLAQAFKGLEKKTENNSKVVINMLVGYGGRDDILFAANKAANMASKGYHIDPKALRDSLLSSSVPDIDFVIRTSGEQRLSGFMPWQTGYSELYFSKKLWPDFTRRDLYNALANYNRRERRFGK